MSEYKREQIAEEDKIDLIRVINNMWKGTKRYGILLILLTGILMVFFVFRTWHSYSPVYTTSATFTVSYESSNFYSTSTYLNEKTAEQIVKTFPYILNSSLLQKMVAEDLGMENVPGSITTETLGSTNMITITVRAADGKIAYQILQSVIEHYPEAAKTVIGDVVLNLLDMTDIPEHPSNQPSYKRSALKGAVAGIGLSFVIVLIYAFTRNTIYGEEDFKKMLNVDCICTIPQIEFKKRSSENGREISIYSRKISRNFLESIRVLRTRIEKDARKNRRKVFLVTSAAAGEGKSTIAANVAMSLAMGGAKVVLVDCDLRNPSVREHLNMKEKGPGLFELLTDRVEFEKVFQWNEKYQMYVIPGGQPYNNASELLNSGAMRTLMNDLREKADYVILDTAPVGMLTDTAVLAEVADAALFVVKQDYVNCSGILEGISELAQSRIYISGCVLNGAKAGVGGYGYKSYHYYNR